MYISPTSHSQRSWQQSLNWCSSGHTPAVVPNEGASSSEVHDARKHAHTRCDCTHSRQCQQYSSNPHQRNAQASLMVGRTGKKNATSSKPPASDRGDGIHGGAPGYPRSSRVTGFISAHMGPARHRNRGTHPSSSAILWPGQMPSPLQNEIAIAVLYPKYQRRLNVNQIQYVEM
jgi:hypothetical protein